MNSEKMSLYNVIHTTGLAIQSNLNEKKRTHAHTFYIWEEQARSIDIHTSNLVWQNNWMSDFKQ